MTTYYRDDSIEVTSHAIRVGGQAYPLGELAAVYYRDKGREAAGWRTLGSRIALALSAPALVAVAIAVAVKAVRMEAGPVAKLLLFIVAGLLALATLPVLDLTLDGVERTYDRGTRVYEICARRRGAEVILVRTGDKSRFGRIYRALQRALDQRS